MRVDLEGFDDVAEARDAAQRFLRETKPPKGDGPLAMYDSYVHTNGPSTARHPDLRERCSQLVRILSEIFGGPQGSAASARTAANDD